MGRGFTPEELEELRRADAEIDASFDGLTQEEYRTSAKIEAGIRYDQKDRKGQERAAYQRAYYEANREEIAAYQRAYREANREERAAYQRAYREANREEIAAYQREKRRRDKQCRGRNKAIGTPSPS